MSTGILRGRSGILAGILFLGLAVGLFFRESLFFQHSLVPTDILRHFLLPGAGEAPIQVQNHYAIDEVVQTYPAGIFWQESVKRGEVPLWNPYIYGGHPQLGTSIWGVLCPVKLLYLFLSPERAHTLGMILELFLAGVFMMAYLREIGQSPWAAWLGACAYAFNSQFMMMYWMWLNVFVWIPLALLFWERALRRESWGYAVAGGFVLALALTGGSIQMSFFAGFLCGFYVLASLFWRPVEQRGKVFGQGLVMVLVALLAGAVQFLPTLELLSLEAGGRIHNSDQSQVSMLHTLGGIPSLLVFVLPALVGSPDTYDLLKIFRGTMMDFTGYVGLIPFAMVLIGAQLRPEKRIRSFLWLIITVLALVFFTPLVKYVYHRIFVVIVFAMAVLSGYGFDLVLQSSPERVRMIRRSFGLMVGFTLLTGVGLLAVQWYIQGHHAQLVEAGEKYILAHAQNHQFRGFQDWLLSRVPRFFSHFRLSNPMFWVPLASLLGAVLLWLAYTRKKIGRVIFASGVILLAVWDLMVLGRSWVPQVDLRKYPAYPPVEVLAKAQADPEIFRIYRWIRTPSLILEDNLLMAYGLSSVGGYESLRPENLTVFMNHTNGSFNRLLDLQNAKYVLTDSSTTLPAERFALVSEAQKLRLYENKTCLPRVRFVAEWQVEPDRKSLLSRMHSATFEPGETVLLEKAPQPTSSTQGNNPVQEAQPLVTVEKYSAQRVVARVRSSRPGLLVLADTWYPGWKARLDGQTTALYRADYILKAVYVPAGEHEIECYFSPATFRIGAMLSLCTLAAGILWGLGSYRRSRKG